MQKYVLSELDSGERVISEQVPSVRSVALGFWIGAGSRDEHDRPARASPTSSSTCCSRARARTTRSRSPRPSTRWARELNAATSREHTVVYSRVPDRHLETALDVMTDMVFAPAFAEIDQEREVVLEEIAMYEDTPQELVHDLFAEAVFGAHALGRPVIGTAEVISTVSRRAIAAYHRAMYTGGNIVVAAAGNVAHDRFVALLQRFERRSAATPRAAARACAGRSCRRRRRACASSARTPSSTTSASARPASPAPTAAGSPPRCSTRSSAARRRRGSSRRSARSAAWPTPSTASPPSTPTPACRRLRRHARGEPRGRASRSPSSRSPRSRPGGRKGELERAKENLKGRIMLSMESTSNRMSRLGKSLIADTELLSLDRIIARDRRRRRGRHRELAAVLLAPDRLSAAGIGPDEERFRTAVELATRRRVARAAA